MGRLFGTDEIRGVANKYPINIGMVFEKRSVHKSL
jgi:hypothetical protein